MITGDKNSTKSRILGILPPSTKLWNMPKYMVITCSLLGICIFYLITSFLAEISLGKVLRNEIKNNADARFHIDRALKHPIVKNDASLYMGILFLRRGLMEHKRRYLRLAISLLHKRYNFAPSVNYAYYLAVAYYWSGNIKKGCNWYQTAYKDYSIQPEAFRKLYPFPVKLKLP